MKKIIFLLVASISIFACTKQTDTSDKNYIPTISYFENGESNEVRLNLPNGGSKVIHVFDEPILQSGKQCLHTNDAEFEAKSHLNGDTSYHLVNTSYSKTSGGRFNIIFVFQKVEEVIVCMEMIEIQGFVDSKLLFKGNLFQTNLDALPEAKEKNNTLKIKKFIKYISDNNSNETIKLIIDDEDVSMEFYLNDELIRMIKGTYRNSRLLMDDEEVNYVLSENNLCYHLEGNDYCYTKTSEKLIK